MAIFDTVLHGGGIIDGAGNPWFYGDLAIKDGRIAAIGRLDPARGRVPSTSGARW